MEIIAKVQSLKQVRNIMDEIASQGDWVVSGKNEFAAIYTCTKGNVTEELRAECKGSRKWELVKETRQIE